MAYIGTNSNTFDPTRTTAAPRDADRFSGNGSTVVFTLSRAVNKATDIEVFVENVQQEPLTAYDAVGTSLNFTGAPPSGTNNVYVVYRNFQSGAQVTMPDGSVTYSKLANNLRIFTTDNLTPNGNNSVFTLSEPPADANTVMVTVDGIIQRAPVHYTTSGSTITFTSAPAAGSNVHVRHLGFRTSTTVTQLAANSTISQPNIASPTITSPSVSGTTLIRGRMAVSDSANTPSSSNGVITSDGYGPYACVRARWSANTSYRSDWSVNETSTFMNSYDDGRGVYRPFAISANSYSVSVGSSGGTVGLNIDSSGVLYFDSGFGSAGKAYGCRAWARFDGRGASFATYGSANISSIVRNATGQYTVTLSTAMPDANYSVVMGVWDDGVSPTQGTVPRVLPSSSTQFTVYTNDPGGTYRDNYSISFAVFR